MTVSERNPTPSNRLGLDGLEFVEFTTTQPLVLGALLERMGFRAVARHRSREVLLYRQGGMNLVVNAHPGVVHAAAADEPVTAVGAMAFRVADAGEAHRQTVALGAWDLPSRAAAMELIIPGIRGAGDSHIYFVDRHATSRSTMSTSPRSSAPTRTCRRWPACTTSAWCRRRFPSAPRRGWSSTSRCSASRCCPAASSSAW